MAKADEPNDVVDVQEDPVPAFVMHGTAPIPDDDALRGITNIEDAIAIASAQWGQISDYAEEYGTGFTVLEDKNALVDKPFLALAWRINEGDFGGFVSMIAVTQEGGKFIVNDGGDGIFRQLYNVTANEGRNGGLWVSGGLRRSEYSTCANCDRPRRPSEAECMVCSDKNEARHRASTYYLAN